MKNENSFANITLRIHSEVLLPDEISQILQISPSKVQIKGTKMSARNPSSAVFEENLWLLIFDNHNSFMELFAEVGNFFTKKKEELSILVEKCEIDLFCGYTPKESQDSFFINHSALKQITSIPVDIIFDVYSI